MRRYSIYKINCSCSINLIAIYNAKPTLKIKCPICNKTLDTEHYSFCGDIMEYNKNKAIQKYKELDVEE
jgi:hypothetical protein